MRPARRGGGRRRRAIGSALGLEKSLSLFIAPPFIIEFWGIVLIKVVIFFFFFLSFFQQSFNPVPNVVIPVVLPGKFCSIFEEWRERERERDTSSPEFFLF